MQQNKEIGERGGWKKGMKAGEREQADESDDYADNDDNGDYADNADDHDGGAHLPLKVCSLM